MYLMITGVIAQNRALLVELLNLTLLREFSLYLETKHVHPDETHDSCFTIRSVFPQIGGGV